MNRWVFRPPFRAPPRRRIFTVAAAVVPPVEPEPEVVLEFDVFPGISCGMAINEVGIGNMALTHLGEEPVLSFTENSKPARFLCQHYENARDQVLRMHPWGCASRRMQLNRLAATPPWGFAYQFQLPDDYLRLVKIEDHKDEYTIEEDKILSDSATMNVIYVFRLKDVTKMDTLLQQAIAYLLAAKGAIVLTNNRALSRDLAIDFKDTLDQAKQVDAVEGPIEVVQVDDWIAARG